ncbi:hemin-degrading factor [Zavarzinia compransoris]|uniref:hemin-degrading factor n=1 Tax=Zavarzinia marina TaxID=2911065 RepID=UPI001F304355|nr:ChuX/HutX family heme-like substrate-binding protein [Zavarzinia marina]MCF4165860.1 hemin-degrading factor [Zavarzinia marina]
MPDDLAPPQPTDVAALARRLADLRAAEPALRAREAAARLGISEGELVALGCGTAATVRLAPRFTAIVARLPELGEVMALTRNESCVHEKVGRYDKLSLEGHIGLVLDPDIDLRIFFGHWAMGFALREDTKDGIRRSLQFFDKDGTAVHKVYLRAGSDIAAFDRLVADFTADGQGPEQPVFAVAPKPAERPDAAIDVGGFAAAWRALEDTHEFFALLRRFDVRREQALRLIGDEFCRPLDRAAIRPLLETASGEALPIMIFVGSAGVIQIHTGPVANIVEMGPWINVMDPGFNLHLRLDRIASSYVVKKPTRDGTVTSVELFDAEGDLIAMLFGKRKPGEIELDAWRHLVDGLPGRA